MGSLKSKPAHFQDGQNHLHPDDLNAMVDIGIRSITGPGTRNFGDRITIDTFRGVTGKELKLFPFKVIKEAANHLVCVPYIPDGFPSVVGNEVYDGFDPGQHVFVAKPFLLQQQPFDARTVLYENGNTEGYVYDPDIVFDRTVNGSGWTDHVDETISPGYFVGDHIWAIYGVTNLYEVSSDSLTSGTITGAAQISVPQAFWESVVVGSRIRLEITTTSSTGTSTTKVYVGADVLAKTQGGGNYYLLLEIRDKDGNTVTLTGTDVSVALETPIVWEDANTGARKWAKKENYPENTFLRLLERTPSKNKYYLAEMKISRATSSGDVSWVNPPVPEKRYVYAELVNNAPPNDDTATLYYGVLSRGPVRTIGHPSYGKLPLYDAFEAGIPARPRFIEYLSQTKDETYTEFYPAVYYTRNVDEAGSVEWLPTACLATMANRKTPTLGHLYMALHVDNNVTLGVLKAGKKRAYHTEGTCCDEDLPDAYYGSGGDDSCPPGYCWSAETQSCYCCSPDCCGTDCWNEALQRCFICCDTGSYFEPTSESCEEIEYAGCGPGKVDIPTVLKVTVEWYDPDYEAMYCAPGISTYGWEFPIHYTEYAPMPNLGFGSYGPQGVTETDTSHAYIDFPGICLYKNGEATPIMDTPVNGPMGGHIGFRGPNCDELGGLTVVFSYLSNNMVNEEFVADPFKLVVMAYGIWRVTIEEYPD